MPSSPSLPGGPGGPCDGKSELCQGRQTSRRPVLQKGALRIRVIRSEVGQKVQVVWKFKMTHLSLLTWVCFRRRFSSWCPKKTQDRIVPLGRGLCQPFDTES